MAQITIEYDERNKKPNYKSDSARIKLLNAYYTTFFL